MLSLHWNSFFPLLCLCGILQLSLAITSKLLFLHLSFKLLEQSRFVKLNELNLVPKHFVDMGHCDSGMAVTIPNLRVRGRGHHANKMQTGFDTSQSTIICGEKPWGRSSTIVIMFHELSWEQKSHPQLSKPHMPVGYLSQSVESNMTNIWITSCWKNLLPSRHIEIGKVKINLCSFLNRSLLKEQYFLVFLPFLTSFSHNHYDSYFHLH